jgi:hypothetical protein
MSADIKRARATANSRINRTAASTLRSLAIPSSRCSSAAGYAERYKEAKPKRHENA